MFEVEVEFFFTKGKSVIYEKLFEGATIRDLLIVLSSKYEQIKDVLINGNKGVEQEIVTLINGKYPKNGLLTRLKDKDRVTLIPIVAGG
ncbi:MAG: MoaD/ThiS family protein [Nitrososphaerales archaeon]